MSAHEWKPGDVAIVQNHGGILAVRAAKDCGIVGHGYSESDHWHYLSNVGGATWDSDGNRAARPLVVIDPEDREQVERFTHLFLSHHWGSEHQTHTDAGQAALREFANPKPPKPDEPSRIGSRVEEANGIRYTRFSDSESHSGGDWINEDGVRVQWSDLDAVRVLSEGVSA